MASTRPLRTRRSVRLAVAGAVALLHLGLLLLASTWRRPEPSAPSAPPNEAFLVTPAAPAPEIERRTASAKLTLQRRRKLRQALQPAAPSAALPPLAPTPPGAGAVASGQPRSGAGSGSGARNVADPWAVQEALRASVGCSLEDLKLRPDERDRCNDRVARWAKKAPKIGPAADDPKRAQQLADEEENNRRRAKWKSGYGEPGMANAALPPRSVNHETSALDDVTPH